MKRNHFHILHSIFIISSCLLLINCKSDDEPEIPVVANFTADNAVGVGITIQCGECVVFEDRSSGDIGSFFWDFEGGDPSTIEGNDRVTVCYKDPGKYDVSLSVNAGEDRITRQEYVCVIGKDLPLDAAFSAENTEVIQGQTILLMDESTGNPESWSWVLEGPGKTESSTDQNPSFQLDTPGNYTVTLTVSVGGVQEVEERVDYITVLAFSDFECRILSSESNFGLSSTYDYNNQGQLIRSDEFFQGVLDNYSIYTWGNDDLLVRAEKFNPNQVRIERQEFAYNAEGIMNQQEIFDTSDISLSKYEFTISNGLITGGTLEIPIPQGGLLKSGLEYKYDDDENNVVEERRFDLNTGDTFQKIIMEFDDNIRPFFELKVELFPERHSLNNPIKTQFINNIGEIFIDRIHEYEYNEFGRTSKESRTSFGATTEFNWDMDCTKK